jgi:hypothetical protein
MNVSGDEIPNSLRSGEIKPEKRGDGEKEKEIR